MKKVLITLVACGYIVPADAEVITLRCVGHSMFELVLDHAAMPADDRVLTRGEEKSKITEWGDRYIQWTIEDAFETFRLDRQTGELFIGDWLRATCK
jgi:hypothetical protein